MKITAKRKQALLNSLEGSDVELASIVEMIRLGKNKSRTGLLLTSLANIHLKKALYAFFVDDDIKIFKQNCYVPAILSLKSLNEGSGYDFGTSGPFVWALLSDSSALINSYISISSPKLPKIAGNVKFPGDAIVMLQAALSGDDEALALQLRKSSVQSRKSKAAQSQLDFFSLLIKGDRKALQELVQKHSLIDSADPRTEGLMSHLGVLETKVCWIRGIEIVVDGPLVPMDLMPIQPLDSYDNFYEFLEPGWHPPHQGILADLYRWMASRLK